MSFEGSTASSNRSLWSSAGFTRFSLILSFSFSFHSIFFFSCFWGPLMFCLFVCKSFVGAECAGDSVCVQRAIPIPAPEGGGGGGGWVCGLNRNSDRSQQLTDEWWFRYSALNASILFWIEKLLVIQYYLIAENWFSRVWSLNWIELNN